jgi:Rieske Fe-S protein
MSEAVSRRSVLAGTVVTLIGGVAGYLATRNTSAAKAAPAGSVANSYGSTSSKTAGGTGATLLTSLSKVPKGGGIVLSGPKVVVTQDSSGQVHGFSAICTHQGCPVSQVAGGTIDCPCHGSKFDAFTGKVVNGPATSPLPPVAVTVRGGNVYRG